MQTEQVKRDRMKEIILNRGGDYKEIVLGKFIKIILAIQ